MPIDSEVMPEPTAAGYSHAASSAPADGEAPEGQFITYPGSPFQLFQPYPPAGDQPTAIAQLCEGIEDGLAFQTLLGVTGSGKTFTMANVIARMGRPAIVFAPTGREMYPDGYATAITVGGPSAGLESDFRPHFFAGVATVVAKLLLQAAPDVAVFGEKDYQQLQVIRRMVRDLHLPVRIVAAETVREPDGLALSSRNQYLSAEERSRRML